MVSMSLSVVGMTAERTITAYPGVAKTSGKANLAVSMKEKSEGLATPVGRAIVPSMTITLEANPMILVVYIMKTYITKATKGAHLKFGIGGMHLGKGELKYQVLGGEESVHLLSLAARMLFTTWGATDRPRVSMRTKAKLVSMVARTIFMWVRPPAACMTGGPTRITPTMISNTLGMPMIAEMPLTPLGL